MVYALHRETDYKYHFRIVVIKHLKLWRHHQIDFNGTHKISIASDRNLVTKWVFRKF